MSISDIVMGEPPNEDTKEGIKESLKTETFKKKKKPKKEKKEKKIKSKKEIEESLTCEVCRIDFSSREEHRAHDIENHLDKENLKLKVVFFKNIGWFTVLQPPLA